MEDRRSMEATRNIVKGFHGSWGSGVAQLEFMDGRMVACENGPTGRALIGATDGKAAGNGHTIRSAAIEGLDIVYWLDDMGLLLEGFAMYDEWVENGLPKIAVGGTVKFVVEDDEDAE